MEGDKVHRIVARILMVHFVQMLGLLQNRPFDYQDSMVQIVERNSQLAFISTI